MGWNGELGVLSLFGVLMVVGFGRTFFRGGKPSWRGLNSRLVGGLRSDFGLINGVVILPFIRGPPKTLGLFRLIFFLQT